MTGARAGSVRIVPFTEAEVPAALAFNRRMREGRAPTDFVLPERPNGRVAGAPPAITWTKYVAMGEEGEARGGFLLMQQPGVVNGQSVQVGNYQAPVSEGILNKRFSMVGVHMLRYVERQWPYAFGVGMGALDRPQPRLLAAAGWTVQPIPFLFRIVRPRRVFRELRLLQQRSWLRLVSRVAADTGAAWMASRVLHARGVLAPRSPMHVERVTAWGAWSNTLWDQVRDDYSFAVVRDSSTLECLYPLNDERYTAYVFRDREATIGWAVCMRTAMRDHQYFGNLTVTTVLDTLALPGYAARCATALTRTAAADTDLIITNQSHGAWIAGFQAAGYGSARSNYLLALSKPLASAIADRPDRVHVTRGDSDGRNHLM